MSSTKNILIFAMTAKNEASYGAGGALSLATDAIDLQKLPEFGLDYAFDGKRPAPQGTFGQVRRNASSGRTAKGQVVVDGKGLGSAYSLTATPPNLHCFLLASGLSGSLSASNAWVYQPDAATNSPKSLVMDVYPRGEKWSMTAGYCSLTIDCPGNEGADFIFDVQALASTPVDAAFPAITLVSASVIPPKAESITLNLGGWSGAKVRSFKFEQKRELQSRVDINSAAGHAGFNPGARNPTFTVVIEAEALATYNPYSIREAGTTAAVSLTMGSVANNKFNLAMPLTQIAEVKPGNDGSVATWEITYEAKESTPLANDSFSLVWN
jgi:hypothetical protein